MTKKDAQYVATGLIAGIGFFVGAWWFRKKRKIPVIAPTLVQWEGID